MFAPNENRYEKMVYNRLGNSGLKVSAVSLGLWQNFGFGSDFATAEEMVHTAFDLGITHFDIANNYGHPYNGSAEENFGKILDRGMREYRDELCISTKAGYEMWDGPYGDKNGSRKYLTASLDQSLRRLKLDYVDIYYHHIFDPDTPLEETALALDNAVRQGKALYVGISNYNRQQTEEIQKIFKELRTPFIVNSRHIQCSIAGWNVTISINTASTTTSALPYSHRFIRAFLQISISTAFPKIHVLLKAAHRGLRDSLMI